MRPFPAVGRGRKMPARLSTGTGTWAKILTTVRESSSHAVASLGAQCRCGTTEIPKRGRVLSWPDTSDEDPDCVACISRLDSLAASEMASPDESQSRDVELAGDGSVESVTPSVKAYSSGNVFRRHARVRLSGGYLEGDRLVPTLRGGRKSVVLGSSCHSLEGAASLRRRRRRSVGSGPAPARHMRASAFASNHLRASTHDL